MPWGWTSSAKWMVSPDLKEDGQQQQSKQEAWRGRYCVGGKLHNTLANPSFQAAGSTTDSPVTACPDSQKVPELLGQRSDANKQLPAGTSVKQLKENRSCHRWVPGDEATPGKHTGTLPPSALLTSDYFYPSGFPKPSIVSVIHQPSVKLFQLLILSPLKAVHFL